MPENVFFEWCESANPRTLVIISLPHISQTDYSVFRVGLKAMREGSLIFKAINQGRIGSDNMYSEHIH